jgi:hypothetical protein
MGIPESLVLYDSRHDVSQTHSSRSQLFCLIPDSQFSLDTWEVVWDDVYTKYEGRSRVSDFAPNDEKLMSNQEVQMAAQRFVFLVRQLGEQMLSKEVVPALRRMRVVTYFSEVRLRDRQRQRACRKEIL